MCYCFFAVIFDWWENAVFVWWKGRRYLDAFGGIATVCCGHCHTVVVDAIVN